MTAVAAALSEKIGLTRRKSGLTSIGERPGWLEGDPTRTRTRRGHLRAAAVVALALLILLPAAIAPHPAGAAVSEAAGQVVQEATSGSEDGASLESAATKAGETGRKVAMSLIGLAFAVAGVVLAFRRDFKEAAGVFVVGIISVLLVTPAGLNLLHDTVNSLFGS